MRTTAEETLVNNHLRSIQEIALALWKIGIDPRLTIDRVIDQAVKDGVQKGSGLEFSDKYVPTPMPIDVLGLPVRIRNALMRAGLMTVEEIIVRDRKYIESIPQMGASSMKELGKALSRIGIDFYGPSHTI